ncbi:MAG: LacI family transcriptional regulator [Bifidobacterium tibiigranuli]|jgi:LacI family transcriptional regulator|nr:LacI family transcriptional regulator [Bifidobacterium tibiigranuli]
MSSKVTIHDIAKGMRVSTATVSRALNDKPGVGKKLKEEIRRYAEHHGYVPNRSAISMRAGKSSTALFVVRSASVVTVGVGSPPMHAIEAITSLGLETRMIRIPYGEDFVKGLQRAEDTYNPFVFFFFGPCEVTDPTQFDAVSTPILFILSDDAPAGYPQIVSDDRFGAKAATESLIAAGHESIMMITECRPDGGIYYRERIHGFKDALAAHGIDFDPASVIALHIDYSDFFASAMAAISAHVIPKLASLRRKPSAIFAASDFLAFVVAKVLANEGIRVPDDISLASFGGWTITDLMPTSIQSWVQPESDIIQTAIHATACLLSGKPFTGTIPLTSPRPGFAGAANKTAGGTGSPEQSSAETSDNSGAPGLSGAGAFPGSDGYAGNSGSPSPTVQDTHQAEAQAISPTRFMVPGYLRPGQSVRRLNGPRRIDLRRSNAPASSSVSSSPALASLSSSLPSVPTLPTLGLTGL